MRKITLILALSIGIIFQLFASEVNPPKIVTTDYEVKALHETIDENEFIKELAIDKFNGDFLVKFSANAPSNIYYKVVEKNGYEVSAGSFHNLNDQTISVQQAANQLPEGEYLIYFETDNQFFIAVSFKREMVKA